MTRVSMARKIADQRGIARGNFLPEFEFLFDVCTRNIVKGIVLDLMPSFPRNSLGNLIS